MTFQEYLAQVAKQKELMAHWRLGQTYFNTLFAERPDLADRIRNTDVDPYYRDDSISVFLDSVYALWEN